KSFIQLYNVIRHNSLPPWDIGYGDLIVPRAKTYVYLIEFAKLIIRHPVFPTMGTDSSHPFRMTSYGLLHHGSEPSSSLRVIPDRPPSFITFS
ncbi:hypothetical protein, partial [Dialister invisus]|uniref:hypothetical protein n=1 Tax=Dialister invisus TaxID=218538 RepID=UPI003AB45325